MEELYIRKGQTAREYEEKKSKEMNKSKREISR